MTESGSELGAAFEPETIERVALKIGARLRRYHERHVETEPPPLFRELLRELDRAERRM